MLKEKELIVLFLMGEIHMGARYILVRIQHDRELSFDIKLSFFCFCFVLVINDNKNEGLNIKVIP